MGLIREIPLGTRWAFAEMVMTWGYPREVRAREVENGHWFTNDDAIVWFSEPVPPTAQTPGSMWEGVLAVHGIGDPGKRFDGVRMMTPRAMLALEVIGELLGAKKLYSLIPKETPNMPVKAMRRYLRRFGWEEDEFGSYKLLGGE